MPDRRKLHEGLRWPRTQSTEREEAWQRLQPVLVTMGLMLHLRHHTQSFTHAISPFFHLYTRLPTTYLKYYTNFYNIHKIYSTYSSVFFFLFNVSFRFCFFLFFFSSLFLNFHCPIPIAIRIVLQSSWKACIVYTRVQDKYRIHENFLLLLIIIIRKQFETLKMIYTISWSKEKKTEKYMPRAEFTNLYYILKMYFFKPPAHVKICCHAYIDSSFLC